MALLLLCLGAWGACGDTGQEFVSYPLLARGVDAAPFQVDDWTVTLETAELAVGPVFFCASVIASAELCPTAQAEFADVAVVDLLNPAPQALGTVEGVSGVIQSMVYDYGITWFISENTPQTHPNAPGGHSARFTGTAVRDDGTTLRFSADMDLPPSLRGGFAVQQGGVAVEVFTSDVSLEVSFDPREWWSRVDFDALAASGLEEVAVSPGSSSFNGLVIGMTANDLPSFVWTGEGLSPAP